MIVTAAAKRYARALFELAKDQNEIDRVLQEFQTVLWLIHQNDVLKLALRKPGNKDRERLLKSFFEKRFSSLFGHFLLLVLKNNRFALIDQILSEYQSLCDSYHHLKRAQVVTTVPLSDEISRQLVETLQHIFQCDVRVENVIDPDILGGLIVEINGKVFDASIQNKFFKLKSFLTKN